MDKAGTRTVLGWDKAVRRRPAQDRVLFLRGLLREAKNSTFPGKNLNVGPGIEPGKNRRKIRITEITRTGLQKFSDYNDPLPYIY